MTAIEKADQRVRELRESRARFEAKTQAARAELAKLRAAAGEREFSEVLTGASGETARRRIAELSEQLSAFDAARGLLLGKLTAAYRTSFIAQAEEVRAQARKLEGDLSVHRQTAAKLLHAIESHEGCQFLPESVIRQAIGFRPGDGPVAVTFSKGDILAQQIAAMLAEATRIEKQTVATSGNASGGTLGQLLLALDGPDLIAPSAAEVEAWFTAAEAQAAAEWQAGGPEEFAPAGSEVLRIRPPRKTQFTIGWRDGVIDPRASGWQSRPVSERERRLEAVA